MLTQSALLCCLSLFFHSSLYAQVVEQSQTTAGTIQGTVRAAQGIALPDVQVTLSGLNQKDRVAPTDRNGKFSFSGLLPGTYQVTVTGDGLQPWTSGDVTLGPGETREVPIEGVPITTTTVRVNASLEEVAVAQVQEQERQRILGFLPNFYVSYRWNAVPLTPNLKFKLAFRSATDPFAFITAAGVAGTEQWHKTFPGYGQGAAGYFKRYGSAYADGVIGRMMGSAVFPAILHQDPRYFYHGTGSTRSRILYAILQTVICRGDNGQLQPNYSHILGSFTAAGISNIYRAPGDRSAALTFRNGLIITGSGAVTNLLREFLSRKLTPSVPAGATGKP